MKGRRSDKNSQNSAFNYEPFNSSIINCSAFFFLSASIASNLTRWPQRVSSLPEPLTHLATSTRVPFPNQRLLQRLPSSSQELPNTSPTNVQPYEFLLGTKDTEGLSFHPACFGMTGISYGVRFLVVPGALDLFCSEFVLFLSFLTRRSKHTSFAREVPSR